LEASFVLYQLQPYYKNFNKRLVKSPKIYFYDTGLACSLLNIKSPDMLRTHYLYGSLFENFVINEVIKMQEHAGQKPTVYYWRDNNGVEIDCIVEVSEIIKLHNKELAGKREPGSISSARIFSAIHGTYRTTINSYSLVQNIQEDKFYFIGTYMGSYRPSSLEEAYSNSINEITSSPFTALGFAPPLDGSSAEGAEGAAGTDGEQYPSDEEIPWEAVIGLVGAGGLAALARKLFRKKPGQKPGQKMGQKQKQSLVGWRSD